MCGAPIAERTTEVDRAVIEAFDRLLAPAVPQGLALLAVGGYGRRELFPHSDVDLLLLFDNDRLAAASKDAIAVFLRCLWDARLRISHSVRTPSECSELHDRNIELNVSLLDQRYLAGDREVYAKLTAKLPRFVYSQRDALARNLTTLAHERHAKFHQTFYHLEPNVKEAPGGLRDHQVICWLDRIKRTTPTALAPAEPPEALQPAHEFLSWVRTYLHRKANRDANVLNFEAQEELAAMRYNGDAGALMRDYFRYARDLYRAASRAIEENEVRQSALLSQFRDWRSRLSNAEFTVSRERLFFRVPQQLDADPHILLRLFQFVARHGVKLARETEERIISRNEAIASWFAQPRWIWNELHQLLALPNAWIGLRAMHETGVLKAIFPELADIECLVIRDFYHRYTVDEHTLVAIQKIAELRGASDTLTKPFSNLLNEIEDPSLLHLALIFHDAGKSSEDEGHVIGSLRVADTAMERIGMPPADREQVRFLIGAHLELSATMQARDLADPQTALQMAHRVATVEQLKLLTLLTYADISAVNDTAMTPWRADLLWRLYLATYRELTRELEDERVHHPAEFSDLAGAFVEGFPTRYTRTHSREEIEAHAVLEEAGRKRGVSVHVERAGPIYKVVVIAGDRQGLFAAIAGALASFGMNILKAEAFSNARGIILDTFSFADPSRTLELNPSEMDRLRVTIERVVLGKQDVKQLLTRRPKPAGRATIPPAVNFDSTVSPSATLIHIVAEDRPGLLYDIANAITARDCNIDVVLIDTEAHRAMDVFYVSRAGKPLDDAEQNGLESALESAIVG